MKISVIAAIDENQVIGYRKDIPWYIPEDLAHFRKTVRGHILLCGRKTYETLPIEFRNKNTIVLTSKTSILGCTTATSVLEAVKIAKTLTKNNKLPQKIFVVGGGQVYAQAIGMADELIISYIKGKHPGDVFFPSIYYEKWKAVNVVNYKNFKVITWRKK